MRSVDGAGKNKNTNKHDRGNELLHWRFFHKDNQMQPGGKIRAATPPVTKHMHAHTPSKT